MMKNLCDLEEKNNIEVFIKESLNDINSKQNVIDNFRLKYLRQPSNCGEDIYCINKSRYITLNIYLLNNLLNLFESTISTSVNAILYLQNKIKITDYQKQNNSILKNYKNNILQHNDLYKNNFISEEITNSNSYEKNKNCCRSHNNFNCHTCLSNCRSQISGNNSNLYYKLETTKNNKLSIGELNNNSQLSRKYYITPMKNNRIIYYDNFLKYKNNTFNNNSYGNTRRDGSFISPFRRNKSNILQELSNNHLNTNSNISTIEKNSIYFLNKNRNNITCEGKEKKNNNINNLKIKSPIRKILQEIVKSKKKNEKINRNYSLNYFNTENNAIKITKISTKNKKNNTNFQKNLKKSETFIPENCKYFFAEKYGNGDYNIFIKKYENNQLDKNVIKNEFKIVSKLLTGKELSNINNNSVQSSNCYDLFNINKALNLSVPQQNKFIKKINKIRSTPIKTKKNSKEKKFVKNGSINNLYSPEEISKKITKITKVNNINNNFNTSGKNKKIKLIIEKNKEPLFRFKIKKENIDL